MSKICDDHPCGVYFDAEKVCIIDISNQKMVAKGPKRNDLYMLESREFSTFFSNRQCSASEEVWHSRLGHAKNFFNIFKPARKYTSIRTDPPPFVRFSKWRRVIKFSFFSSDSIVAKPLERVHRDVWDPSPVVSNQEFKYYAIFGDEYYSWFYPIKLKSEFYYIFIMFQKLVENQLNRLGTKIKKFQWCKRIVYKQSDEN